MITAGHASVEYNAKNVLNSTYICKSEKVGGNQERDVIDLSIENEMRPIGIHYTHEKKKRPAQKFEFVSQKLFKNKTKNSRIFFLRIKSTLNSST